MEAIVCQTCEKVIAYVDSEKVGILYAACGGCEGSHEEEEDSPIKKHRHFW
jgi:hypothetical protein